MSIPPETNNGEVTSWIPLTAAFTPTEGCESYFRLNGPSLAAFDPGYGLDIDRRVKCATSAVTTWWEQGRLGDGLSEHTAVSIQPLTCPDAWSTVASSIKDGSSTQAMCCPSGYYLTSGVPGRAVGDCLSDVQSGDILTYASTESSVSEVWYTKTTTLSTSSHVGAIAVVGWNVARIAASATPMPTFTATTPDIIAATANESSTGSSRESPPPSSTSTPTSSSSVSTTASSSTTSTAMSSPSAFTSTSLSSSPLSASTVPSGTTAATESKSSNAMSPGVKAGIGLGAFLGVIGVAALIMAMVMLRRRGKKGSSHEAAPESVYPESKRRMPLNYTADGQPQVFELPHHVSGQPVELPARRSAVELEAFHPTSKGWSAPSPNG